MLAPLRQVRYNSSKQAYTVEALRRSTTTSKSGEVRRVGRREVTGSCRSWSYLVKTRDGGGGIARSIDVRRVQHHRVHLSAANQAAPAQGRRITSTMTELHLQRIRAFPLATLPLCLNVKNLVYLYLLLMGQSAVYAHIIPVSTQSVLKSIDWCRFNNRLWQLVPFVHDAISLYAWG